MHTRPPAELQIVARALGSSTDKLGVDRAPAGDAIYEISHNRTVPPLAGASEIRIRSSERERAGARAWIDDVKDGLPTESN